MSERWDAVVVGSGPNGLAAGVALAREGLAVLVLEAQPTVGGGVRSAELTLPGFVHDVCSSIHPLAASSPFLRSLPLAEHGLSWVHAPSPLAHPLEGAPAARLERGVEETAAALGGDGERYRRLVEPLVEAWEDLEPLVLGGARLPRRPGPALRLLARATRSAERLARGFEGPAAAALLAGSAAHSGLRLDQALSGGVALVLTVLGHVVGWPFPRGGAQKLADALASQLRGLGGEVRPGAPVHSLAELPPARAVLLDVTPRQLLGLAGDRLPSRYRRRLARWRYGPGVFKVDWALGEPIPWRDPRCAEAGVVHLGGSPSEIAAAERDVARGRVPERPFVILAQTSRFDPTRAPAGRHTGWAYCHVPRGAAVEMTGPIEDQVERFAPGFRDVVLARSALGPADLERIDENHVGGSIDGGLPDLRQSFARPVARWDPHATPLAGLYLCSSSTPPGSGVHGMCGALAARSALRRTFGSSA